MPFIFTRSKKICQRALVKRFDGSAGDGFEAFNVFNNVNLSLPNSTVTASNFMRITSAASPRILQLALRLEF